MEVEMRVLLGLLNEIYIYPTEMMAKARELDDKNPISTSSILREKRKAQLTPEALEKFDTRLSIFIDEANYTNAQYKDEADPRF